MNPLEVRNERLLDLPVLRLCQLPRFPEQEFRRDTRPRRHRPDSSITSHPLGGVLLAVQQQVIDSFIAVRAEGATR